MMLLKPQTKSVLGTAASLSKSARHPTGIKGLDEILAGGLPQGQISEIVGPISSGKTGLLLRILSETSWRGERVAFVDPFHSFDPVSAAAAGLDLSRLLWVRSQRQTADNRLQQAFKATDILIRSETFCLVAMDLERSWMKGSPGGIGRAIPFNSWFRIKKTLQGKKISVLVLSPQPVAGSAAAVVLGLERRFVKWKSPRAAQTLNPPGHSRLLEGLCSEVRLLRGKRHGRVTLHCSV